MKDYKLGLIKFKEKELLGIEVFKTEKDFNVGHSLTFSENVFGVIVEKDFDIVKVTSSISAILSKILDIQKNRDLSFFDAFLIYIDSIDHFIKIHKNLKKS